MVEQGNTLIVKTLLASGAGYYLFGSKVAFGVAGINVALWAIRSQHIDGRPWLGFDGEGWKAACRDVFDHHDFSHPDQKRILATVAVLIAGQFLTGGVARHLRSLHGSAADAAMGVAQACVFQPIAQEILWRGFVQEKIDDVQELTKLRGVGGRIVVQAVLCALAQGLKGSTIQWQVFLPSLAMAGGLGYFKEREHTHKTITNSGIRSAMVLHMVSSLLVMGRLLTFG